MTLGSLCLNGTWDLTYIESASDCYHGESLGGRKTIPAAVPAPIHQVLEKAGRLEDPLVGTNTLKARWVEEQYWIYRRTFSVPSDVLNLPAWLVFEKLELNATVYLNGQCLGSHANSFRPARFAIRNVLRTGENLLVVNIESGVYASSDMPGKPYLGYASLTKRPWRRSPQYQSGWDWTTHLLNVGILGDVRLEWCAGPRLDQVTLFAVPAENLASARLYVRAAVEGVAGEPVPATIRVRLIDSGQEASLPLMIAAGESRHEVQLEIQQPRLWWPVNFGEPYRYTVDVTLEAGGETQTRRLKTGIRRVEIDQSPHPVKGRHFIVKINNCPIFCKGGNWVPPDLFYSAVTPERYRRLVKLAGQANFNMLRIWGGGLFADHALCDACDEAGILIWHDFLFACAQFPGQDPAFASEVSREVTHAVRELAHHPSLVVWCGNNEIELGDWAWGYAQQSPAHPHYALFHHTIPRIVLQENPAVFYWPSSPYSPDHLHPNDPTVGDQHPWAATWSCPGGSDGWEYRRYEDRFPNEGGMLGVSSPATLRQFLPEGERALRSPSWDHHDNPIAYIGRKPGEMGLAYQTVQLWTGRDPMSMDWEEYAFVSALLQAEGLQEYIANYRHRMFSSASAIFWMYNDCWPATHGWTIVDYYLRKKLAYHPVRRAFQPVTTVVADEQEKVTVYGVNDTPTVWKGDLRYGLFTLAGQRPLDRSIPVTLPAHASTVLASFPRSEWEALGLTRSGAFSLLSQGWGGVAQHRLFSSRFKDLAFVVPPISMTLDQGVLTLSSPAFAWGVCLDVEGELPLADNCFDLLPCIPYTVPWSPDCGEPRIVRLGNRDAVAPARPG